MSSYNFSDLFILDIANNHQGDVAHGSAIIEQLGAVVADLGIRAAIKFQFRQLDSFIHPDHMIDSTAKHINRFKQTRLSLEQYEILISVVRQQNMLTMCTPFDEESVDRIQEMDFDIVKIASCSMTDRPLIEKIESAKMPVVISTGGATISEIDRIVQRFRSARIPFALEHCVSIYPTPSSDLQLNQIDYLQARYPDVAVGWSTHEDPNDMVTVQLAVAKGAGLFERHVGLESKENSLNAYSSNPAQIRSWLIAHGEAKARCGAVHRSPASQLEKESLISLKRGVFAARNIKKGEKLQKKDIYFAMPAVSEGLNAESWKEGVVADADYSLNAPLAGILADYRDTDEERINGILLQIQGLLHVARIKLAESSRVELSHHYGLERFREFGAVIIDVINREYCKKLIIQLPRQKHPYHFHKRKEETFQVLYGDLEVEKNGEPKELVAGDLFLVEPDNWHKFSTRDGVVFEEISTTHFDDDSFYEDPKINNMERSRRKTVINHWQF